MMDAFRNYDAWLQHDPAMDLPDEIIYRCECGCFLKHDTDSTEFVENKIEEETHDGMQIVDYSFYRHHRICANCGADNFYDDF